MAADILAYMIIVESFFCMCNAFSVPKIFGCSTYFTNTFGISEYWSLSRNTESEVLEILVCVEALDYVMHLLMTRSIVIFHANASNGMEDPCSA